jgi:integrative and conjugative element protein (TIGR02256 family)
MPETDPLFLVFSRHNGGRIKVTAAVLRAIQGYAQHGRRATEAGGVLLGRYLQGSADVVIDAVTVPMPGDKRSRYSFYRDKARHQAAIDAAWQASGGTCTYLGEWHTHPETHPTPSSIDTTDWRRRLRTDDYHDELFFLIVGTVEIRAWSGNSLLLASTPLPPILVTA